MVTIGVPTYPVVARTAHVEGVARIPMANSRNLQEGESHPLHHSQIWVGCDDGIGHAVERVFGKRGSVVLLSALGQDKFAELLLNYRLQMRVSGCD